MTFLLTIFFCLLILLILLKVYRDFYYITKKRKFNKAVDAKQWLIGRRYLPKWFNWPVKEYKVEEYDYKILKNKEEEVQ
ncbi:hypothetical protein [Pedobacter sp. Hv1]|uniref:hypothetical protein n=1 Tax=Pedobacter sp. Hv1 TaxID=1740090 RepID=UPI0006D889E5|nr:hypothetical protein [Pedobacter sp. Hv1]KQC01865.1 hypothetical protein AQF98_05745 [Pedobacter sp. Hv1]